MGRPAYQDNWRAEEELAIPECLMKAADGRRNVEKVITIVVIEENCNSLLEMCPKWSVAEVATRTADTK